MGIVDLKRKEYIYLIEKRLFFILRVILGVIFIWAGLNKILDPESFARIIYNYRILPSILVNPVAIVLPWVEVVCGLLLVSGHLVKGSALIIDILMIIFILAFITNVYRGIDIGCGCFSLALQTTRQLRIDLVRDVLLLCAGLWILYYKIRADQYNSTRTN